MTKPTKLKIEYYGQFKKDFKLAVKRGCDIEELKKVISFLANGEQLPEKYRDHALTDSRQYKGVRECHIKPDWLLIYKICEEVLILTLERVRTPICSEYFLSWRIFNGYVVF